MSYKLYVQLMMGSSLNRRYSVALFLFLFQAAVATLIVDDLKRTVDLNSRIVRVSIETTLSNPSKTEDAKYFLVALPEHVNNKIGQIQVRQSKRVVNIEDVSKSNLPEVRQNRTDFVVYKVPIGVPKQSKIEYHLEYLIGKVHRPLPQSIPFKVK